MSSTHPLLAHAPVTPLSTTTSSAVPVGALAVIEWCIFHGYTHKDVVSMYNGAGYGSVSTKHGISYQVRRWGPVWYREQGAVRPWELYTKVEKEEFKKRGLSGEDFKFVHPRELDVVNGVVHVRGQPRGQKEKRQEAARRRSQGKAAKNPGEEVPQHSSIAKDTRQQAATSNQPKDSATVIMSSTDKPTEEVDASARMSTTARKRRLNEPYVAADAAVLPTDTAFNTDQPSEHNDNEDANSPPMKKRKTKSNSLGARAKVAAKDIPSDEEIKAFIEGLAAIEDWTSQVVDTKYIQLVQWYDVEGISMKQCGTKWVEEGYAEGRADPKKQKTEVTESGMWKHYSSHGRKFLEEKGLVWVSPSARKAYKKRVGDVDQSRKTIPDKTVPHKTVSSKTVSNRTERIPSPGIEEEEPLTIASHTNVLESSEHMADEPMPSIQRYTTPQPQEEAARGITKAAMPKPEDYRVGLHHGEDEELLFLLSRRVKAESRPSDLICDFEKKGKSPAAAQSSEVTSDPEAEAAEAVRYKNSRATEDVLSFKRKTGDVRRGHPTRPILSRKQAIEHCTFIKDAIKNDPTVDTIEYGDDIDADTIARFVACISPDFRAALPTHDVVGLVNAGHPVTRTTEIQWSIQELEDLYVFAHTMGALAVCDMIIDRVYEELHRPQQRLISTIDGAMEKFGFFRMSPAFMNLLSENDTRAFNFFVDALAMKAEDTLELLKISRLDSWYHESKQALMTKLEIDWASGASKSESAAICPTYHHHWSPATGCYKSAVSTAPLISKSSAAKQSAATSRTLQKRPEPYQRKDRKAEEKKEAWAKKVAFQTIDREANGARGRGLAQFEAEQARLQKVQQDLHDEDKEYNDSSDSSHSSDDEDVNVIFVQLPRVYSRARDLFRNSPGSYAEPSQYTVIASDLTHARFAARSGGGLNYSGEGMNLSKDTAEIQRKKVAIVEGQLQMFRDSGYDPDNLQGSGQLRAMSQRTSEDGEMIDGDESDDED
ncbi:hypothetical protein J4E93_000147 [Alternaria ventricosa]|uniref:uncharacterized protein n=1 Tax=Alternaria ventricosa TaxID=1187951 RepID=UPI0020C26337|nr:uncharacterized protein J4E93_000147 [Alternaria ventricosa]KAI4655435.1 hypothetical protein J4E93_000147 [Alternaria ventricosa]